MVFHILEGVLLVLGIFLCILVFYNSNRYILALNLEKYPKHAHGQ